MHVSHLATMLPRTCKQAGTQSFHVIQKLSAVGLDLRERFVSASRQKCKSYRVTKTFVKKLMPVSDDEYLCQSKQMPECSFNY